MSPQVCMYCGKDMSKWNLDFEGEIVCDDCTQNLVGSPEMPLKRPERRSKSIVRLKPIQYMEE